MFGFFSLFNPSQLFLLLSFLGVIGVYFWFQANATPKDEEEENKKEKQENKNSNTTAEAEDESLYNAEDIKQRKRHLTEQRHQQVRQIETIYESHLEEVTAAANAEETQKTSQLFEIQQTLEETKKLEDSLLDSAPCLSEPVEEPAVEVVTAEPTPISEPFVDVICCQPAQAEEPIIEETPSEPTPVEPIVEATPVESVTPFESINIEESTAVSQADTTSEKLTIDQTIDMITNQMANKQSEEIANLERNASRTDFSDVSSDELTELSSDETNERLCNCKKIIQIFLFTNNFLLFT